nr:MAG TPA: hypothetical protein [Caudoviricetes sp.]
MKTNRNTRSRTGISLWGKGSCHHVFHTSVAFLQRADLYSPLSIRFEKP